MMKLKLSFPILLLIAGGAVWPVPTSGCEQLTVSEVYDHLMPLDLGRGSSTETVILRYIPGDTTVEREMAVRLSRRPGSAVLMDVWEPQGTSALSQLRALRQRDEATCDAELLKSVVIDHTSETSRTASQLLDSLLRTRITLRLDSALYLDAPRYEIAVAAPMNEVRVVLYGPGIDSRSPHPLITWAETVLSAARKRK